MADPATVQEGRTGKRPYWFGATCRRPSARFRTIALRAWVEEYPRCTRHLGQVSGQMVEHLPRRYVLNTDEENDVERPQKNGPSIIALTQPIEILLLKCT